MQPERGSDLVFDLAEKKPHSVIMFLGPAVQFSYFTKESQDVWGRKKSQFSSDLST